MELQQYNATVSNGVPKLKLHRPKLVGEWGGLSRLRKDGLLQNLNSQHNTMRQAQAEPAHAPFRQTAIQDLANPFLIFIANIDVHL